MGSWNHDLNKNFHWESLRSCKPRFVFEIFCQIGSFPQVGIFSRFPKAAARNETQQNAGLHLWRQRQWSLGFSDQVPSPVEAQAYRDLVRRDVRVTQDGYGDVSFWKSLDSLDSLIRQCVRSHLTDVYEMLEISGRLSHINWCRICFINSMMRYDEIWWCWD